MNERLYTRQFWILFLAHTCFCIINFALALLPVFLSKLGADKARIGILLAAMVLGRLLLRPVWGILMDRFGRRLTFLLAGIPVPLMLFLYSQQAEPGIGFAIVCFIHGMALGGMFSTFFTYINDICPSERRAEGIAVFGLSGFIGMAVGPMIGELIEMHFGFICLFRIFSIIAVLTLLIVRFLPESLAPDDSPTATAPRLVDFYLLIKSPELLLFWSILLAFGCAVASHRTFLAPMAREYRMGALGYFFTTYAATAILVRIFAARLPDRIGRLRVLVPAVICQACGLIVLTLLVNAQGMFLAGMLAGIGHAYIFPITNAMIIDHAGPRHRGIAMACFTMAMDLGAVLGNTLLGYMAEAIGFIWMFRVVVVIILMALMPLWLSSRSPGQCRQVKTSSRACA